LNLFYFQLSTLPNVSLYDQDKYVVIRLGIMSGKYQDHYGRKIFLTTISAAVLVGSFVVGSQFVQPSAAQDLSQLGQQAEDRIG
jgi:hypothetical protein